MMKSMQSLTLKNVPIFMSMALIIIEFSWIFISVLSDYSVFAPSVTCAENTAIAGEMKKSPETLTS